MIAFFVVGALLNIALFIGENEYQTAIHLLGESVNLNDDVCNAKVVSLTLDAMQKFHSKRSEAFTGFFWGNISILILYCVTGLLALRANNHTPAVSAKASPRQ